MASPEVSNPNDFRVVTFTNKETFDFTPEMGCMYDSRPIFGTSGAPGIIAGESIVLPYHIAILLARNLAKVAMTRTAPPDQPGVPTGVVLWDTTKLDAVKLSYIKDLYTEQKPIKQSESEILLAKIEEFKRVYGDKLDQVTQSPVADDVAPQSGNTEVNTVPTVGTDAKGVYKDKAEVITELEKRGIRFNARSSKDTLEKLLVA